MTDRHVLPPYSLRMTAELRSQLEKAASDGKRSLNAEIIARLERSFESDSIGGPRDAIDTLGFQSILVMMLMEELDLSSLTPAQQMAADGLRQISERIADRIKINKKGSHLMGYTNPVDDPDYVQPAEIPEHLDFEPSPATQTGRKIRAPKRDPD